jgi:hypothetical protein
MNFFPFFSVFVLSTIVFASLGIKEDKTPAWYRVEIGSLMLMLISFVCVMAFAVTDAVSKAG